MLSYRKLRLLNSSGQSSNSSDDELYSNTEQNTDKRCGTVCWHAMEPPQQWI